MKTKIILDPGVGFGKTLDENLKINKQRGHFEKIRIPDFAGNIKKIYDRTHFESACGAEVEGTLATTVIGVMKGCSFVRVHDVKENKRVIDMTEAILAERQIYG